MIDFFGKVIYDNKNSQSDDAEGIWGDFIVTDKVISQLVQSVVSGDIKQDDGGFMWVKVNEPVSL